MDKSHIRTKKDDMPRMQRFELSLNDTIKLLTSRAPLDSTVTYPITRSPNTHHETVKRENLSRSYLCLEHIPLEVDDDDLVHLKMDLLS